jgi:hypothetical protein
MFNYITAVVDYVKSSYTKIVSAFHADNYLFFDTYDTVYPEHLVNLSANLSATPTWVYSKDTCVFRLCRDERLVPISMPYLSLEIVLNGKVMYDMTDYIEKLKVYTTDMSDAPTPSLIDILTAWSLHSGVVLDNKKAIIYRIITDSGETIEFRQNEESDVTEDAELETEVIEESATEEISEVEPLLAPEVSTNDDKED